MASKALVTSCPACLYWPHWHHLTHSARSCLRAFVLTNLSEHPPLRNSQGLPAERPFLTILQKTPCVTL